MIRPMAQPSTPDHGAASAASKKDRARTVAVGILAVLATIFALVNLDQVRVHFLFGSAQMPLIIVIVGCLLIGAAIGAYLSRRGAKRR